MSNIFKIIPFRQFYVNKKNSKNNNIMIGIENKICLRKANLTDIDALYEIKNDKEASKLLGGFSTGYSKMDVEKWIVHHNDSTNEIIYMIESIPDNKLVGHVGLYNIDYRIRKAEFGILITTKNQGKGYGTLCTKFMIDYAFNELNINKICLSLLVDNQRAYSLYKKLGFIQEGYLRNEQYKNGKYNDVILMALFNDR